VLIYVELKKIKKEDFDTDILIVKDGLTFNHSSFKTYDDLIHGAINNFNITLGFTSIVLDASLEEAGIIISQNDNKEKIRSLVRLIRNAYAHNMMYPIWFIDRKIQKIFSIDLGKTTIDIDLSGRNNNPFDISHLGGVKTYFDLKDEAYKIIESV
jgi:hypothetical protein